MISIEELCGIKNYVLTEEDKIERRRLNATKDMEFYDLLPKSVRDILNFADIPIECQMAAHIHKLCGYNEVLTCKRIKEMINDYKRRNSRNIK